VELSEAEEPVDMHWTLTAAQAAHAEIYWERNWTHIWLIIGRSVKTSKEEFFV